MSEAPRGTRALRQALVWLLIASYAGAASAEPSGSGVAASPGAGPFSRGSRYWSVAAGTSRHRTFARLYISQIAVSHYVRQNLAMVYGGLVGYMDAERTTSGALAAPELGMRWHAVTRQRWSAYVDGLVGAMFQEHPLSQDSLQFNFDVQAGVGGTYRLTSQELLLGGFRWQHLSNAQIKGKKHNLGYDAPMLYLGLAKSF